MPLPYDIDGVSTGEQLKFLREKFFLDHGCEAAGPTVQESANTDQYDPHHMQLLRSLVSTQDVLEKYGYVIEPLTGEKLENKKRCRGCDKCKWVRMVLWVAVLKMSE